jgi:hypothetical protein
MTTDDRCIKYDRCSRYADLADLLGHDRRGHAILFAVVIYAGITTPAALAEANLHDVRGLGATRIAYVHQRLAEGSRP